MADTAPAEPAASDLDGLSDASRERIGEIRSLTQKSRELYAALEATAERRNQLIVDEMKVGTVARIISEASGLTVARIYKLRDNGRKG